MATNASPADTARRAARKARVARSTVKANKGLQRLRVKGRVAKLAAKGKAASAAPGKARKGAGAG